MKCFDLEADVEFINPKIFADISGVDNVVTYDSSATPIRIFLFDLNWEYTEIFSWYTLNRNK